MNTKAKLTTAVTGFVAFEAACALTPVFPGKSALVILIGVPLGMLMLLLFLQMKNEKV